MRGNTVRWTPRRSWARTQRRTDGSYFFLQHDDDRGGNDDVMYIYPGLVPPGAIWCRLMPFRPAGISCGHFDEDFPRCAYDGLR